MMMGRTFAWSGVSSMTSFQRLLRRKKSRGQERRKLVSPGSQESFRLCLRKFNCRHTAQNIMEMTQKILDDYNIRQKTNVLSDRISVRMTDLSKVELTSTELDVNIMNAEEEGFCSGGSGRVSPGCRS